MFPHSPEAYLEGPLVVQTGQGIGEAVDENAVEPALEDGWHPKPLQWELRARVGQAVSAATLFPPETAPSKPATPHKFPLSPCNEDCTAVLPGR